MPAGAVKEQDRWPLFVNVAAGGLDLLREEPNGGVRNMEAKPGNHLRLDALGIPVRIS